MMERHLCIRVGGVMFQNGVLYRWRVHRNHDGKVRWFDWDVIVNFKVLTGLRGYGRRLHNRLLAGSIRRQTPY